MSAGQVVILGAGVGGLAAAWWLGRAGWDVTIIEQAQDLRADGYMLGLSGPGFGVAKAMGLMPALRPLSREIGENVFRDRRGRELLRLRYRDFLRGLDWLTLTRTDLVATLRDAVAPFCSIRFGTALQAMTQDASRVRAMLTDGTALEADLLIGADGARSALRRRLFGEDGAAAQPLGYRAAAFQVPDRIGIGEHFLSYAEPGRLAETYTLQEGRLATLYIWRSTEIGFVPRAERRAVLRNAFADAHPHALQWVDDLAPEEPIYLDALTMIDLPAWSRGHALLLGDAAHCLTLISGQGAGMAMTSARILAEELAAGPDIPAGLARHEARLRPAIRRLQEHSRRTAAWFIPNSRSAFHLRNTLMRWTPRGLLARRFLSAIRSEQLLALER